MNTKNEYREERRESLGMQQDKPPIFGNGRVGFGYDRKKSYLCGLLRNVTIARPEKNKQGRTA